LRLYVVVRFVDIAIGDHHCLNFLFIRKYTNFIDSKFFYIFYTEHSDKMS